MYYENLENYVGIEHKTNYYDKEKIIITKRHGSLDYTLRWNDLSLWGTFYMQKEFVRYSKIRLYDKLPDQLSVIEDSDQNCFEKVDNYYVCNEIGRYVFYIENKKWIVDVIFPFLKDKSWSEETTSEYMIGKNAKRASWIYDLNDASMGEFVMRIINSIEEKDKKLDYVIRNIMLHFASENREDALIHGNWDGKYEDGQKPGFWDHTSQIFRLRQISSKPVKYGQCWVFAECMTAVLRFLGIASRTVHAKNSHINLSKNFSIDMFGYYNTEKGIFQDIYYKKIQDLHSFLFPSTKSEENLSGRVYARKDSMWNFHYWNEYYTAQGWKCLDPTPVIQTEENPFISNKILGPCSVFNIRSGIEDPADFVYLSSSVNSPFRLWGKSVITVNGENKDINFLHSIVFPFYPEKSIISRENSLSLNNQVVTLQTICKNFLDITDNYKMPYEKVHELIHRNHPAIFLIISDKLYVNFNPNDEEEYTVQQICLDVRGIPIFCKRNKSKLWEIVPINIEPGTKFLSFSISSEKKVWPQLLSV